MASLNRFTGSPWHVGKWTRKNGDPRRHRSRCKYYSRCSNHCSKINSNCFGTAHCQYYKERSISTSPTKSTNVDWKPKTRSSGKYAKRNKQNFTYTARSKKTLTVGSQINDSTYGKGIIKSIYNGLAVVAFEDVGDVLINLTTSEKSGALKKIEKIRGRWN